MCLAAAAIVEEPDPFLLSWTELSQSSKCVSSLRLCADLLQSLPYVAQQLAGVTADTDLTVLVTRPASPAA